MDKLVATVLMIILVISLYLVVFEGNLSNSIINKGQQVENIINGTN